MTAYELMGKIVEESDKGTEFYKELSATTDAKDKLKCIQMLMEHFDCGFDEARIVMDNVLNREPVLPDPDPIREAKAAESMRKVTCPYCGSVNVKKVSTISRMASVSFFGLSSKKVGKQWHCNNCKSDF
mgnify:FL=1